MKKITINICFFLAALLLFNSCEKQLDDKYFNPEKSDDPTLPGLFTAMLNNDRIAQKYWNVRTFLSMTGVYSQTTYIPNSQLIYQQSDGYSQQFWDDFYAPGGNGSGVMALYRTMETKFAASSEAEQGRMQVFMTAGKVALIEEAAKMVDLWGDIPYSQAGSLNTSGNIANAKYDDQKELYTTFLSDLTSAAAYFKTAPADANFSKYDILLSGSMKKWEKYCNSLKLRLLMHMSFSDESTARTQVLAMLNDPANFPLIDGDNIASYAPATSDVLLQPLTTSQSDLNSAYQEGTWYAPDYMLNTAMVPNNDPRTPFFFEKFGRTANKVFTPNKDFRAMPNSFTADQQSNSFEDYAVYDSATFAQNIKLPGFVITAPEVNLLKAEAYERWVGSAQAKASYDIALQQSIAFYQYCNSVSTINRKEAAPTAADITAFVNTSGAAYKVAGTAEQKLEQIAVQKWIHLGYLQSIEAWTEVRRTSYPRLTFPSDGKTPGFTTVPNRLIYPSQERALNRENWEAVSAKDTRDAKVFWDVK